MTNAPQDVGCRPRDRPAARERAAGRQFKSEAFDLSPDLPPYVLALLHELELERERADLDRELEETFEKLLGEP